MSLVYRWLLRLFTAALVLGVLAVLFIYYLASRSLPEYQARHVELAVIAESFASACPLLRPLRRALRELGREFPAALLALSDQFLCY